jgi:hypothetical protein
MKARKAKSVRVFIPTIGTVFTLAEDWTFPLYDESRNDAMIAYQGLTDAIAKRHWGNDPKILKNVTLPTGTTLKVDRIYIRKGSEELKAYDSVTFIVQSIPDVNIAVTMPQDDWQIRMGKNPRTMRTIRFWAKLNDVNQMKVTE